jgi:hypothetical protein
LHSTYLDCGHELFIFNEVHFDAKCSFASWRQVKAKKMLKKKMGSKALDIFVDNFQIVYKK